MITILLISGLLAISVIVRMREERTHKLRGDTPYPKRYELEHCEADEKVYDVIPKSVSIMQAASDAAKRKRVKR